jgi:hypothetical protein
MAASIAACPSATLVGYGSPIFIKEVKDNVDDGYRAN